MAPTSPLHNHVYATLDGEGLTVIPKRALSGMIGSLVPQLQIQLTLPELRVPVLETVSKKQELAFAV